MTTTVEYSFLNRDGWGPGPWDEEPDRIDWRDEATGLPTIMVRNHSGAWCGYVAVPPGHPWHGVDFAACKHGPRGEDDAPTAHGGITYSEPCVDDDSPFAVCHKPAKGESDDVWWIGFDTLHAWDLAPGTRHRGSTGPLFGRDEVYRSRAYVQKQCVELARQVAERARA